MSSSLSRRKKTKISVKKQTSFKKSVLCSASKKNTNLCMREDTLFGKASQLATLCAIDVCIIYFRHNGELKIWPEESKVREMAEEYMKLNDKERMKKSTNIFVISKKKLLQNKKFSEEKITEMENSLISQLQILEPEFFGVDNLQAEPDQRPVVPFATNISNGQQHLSDTTSSFTRDLSWGVSSTGPDVSMSSFSQDESKFPVILYNHDNSTYYQVPISVSRFDPLPLPSNDTSLCFSSFFDLLWNNLSTTQQFGLRSNNYIDLFPPQMMQTQIPVDQFASWYYQPTSFQIQ